MLNLSQTSKVIVVTKLSTPVELRSVSYNISYQSGLSNTKNTYMIMYETEFPTNSSLNYVLNYTSIYGNDSNLYTIRYTSGVDRNDRSQLYLVKYTVQYPSKFSNQYSVKYTSQSAEMAKNRRVFKIRYATEGSSSVSQLYTVRYRTPSLMKRLLDYKIIYSSETPYKTSFKVFNLEGTADALLIAVSGETSLENVFISSYGSFYDMTLEDSIFEYIPKEDIENEPLLRGDATTRYFIWKGKKPIQECNIVCVDEEGYNLYSENTTKQIDVKMTGPIYIKGTSYTYFTELVNKPEMYTMATTINPLYKTTASCCLQTKINDNTRRGECSPI